MRMTRFWITLAQAVQFVALSVRDMVGGEIFVPKLPSLLIADMAKAIDPQATLKEIGIRPGEKIHETLIMKEEASHTLARDQDFIVLPEWFHTETKRPYSGGRLPAEFQYTSDRNDQWLSVEEMRHWIEAYEHQEGLN
jgi:UDP-N-acetylglucosamine 4,6-dehydratase